MLMQVNPVLLIVRLAPVTGVVGAVILPVVGVGVGLTQVGRGIYYTPEAIRESAKGRFWNHVSPGRCSQALTTSEHA